MMLRLFGAGGQGGLCGLACRDDLDAAALDRDRPTATALALLAAQDIPALSLLEPFRVAGEWLYFPGDGHFNPAGHALTAQLLTGWLQEANLIAEESAP